MGYGAGRDMHAEVWNSLGVVDPDWAVVSMPDKRHGAWANSLEEFYASGEARVREALAMVPALQFTRALDWGSGTGRLSFALASRFKEVTCVDASTTMLAKLNERARQRNVGNVRTVQASEFVSSEDHDLALCLITLQHFRDRQSVAAALRAMIIALRPGGYLIAELPLRPHNIRYRVQPRLQVYRAMRLMKFKPAALHTIGLSGISMLCAPTTWVSETITQSGADIVEIQERRGTSHQQAYYVARRR